MTTATVHTKPDSLREMPTNDALVLLARAQKDVPEWFDADVTSRSAEG